MRADFLAKPVGPHNLQLASSVMNMFDLQKKNDASFEKITGSRRMPVGLNYERTHPYKIGLKGDLADEPR